MRKCVCCTTLLHCKARLLQHRTPTQMRHSSLVPNCSRFVWRPWKACNWIISDSLLVLELGRSPLAYHCSWTWIAGTLPPKLRFLVCLLVPKYFAFFLPDDKIIWCLLCSFFFLTSFSGIKYWKSRENSLCVLLLFFFYFCLPLLPWGSSWGISRWQVLGKSIRWS